MKKVKLVLALLVGSLLTNAQFPHLDSLNNEHKTLYPAFVFQEGERLEYKMSYGVVNAGIGTLEVKKAGKDANGKSLLKVVGEGKTTGAFDWFYKVRDLYESTFYADGVKPVYFKRRVNEGGYIINQDHYFFHDKYVLDNGKHDTLVPAPNNIQDILSAFYYARTIDLSGIKEGEIISIATYLDYEYYPIKVKFKGVESKKIGIGEFECMRFTPVVQKGRVFKTEDDLSIWITNDQNKIPILAQAKIIVGSVRMELTSYKGLSGPVAKL